MLPRNQEEKLATETFEGSKLGFQVCIRHSKHVRTLAWKENESKNIYTGCPKKNYTLFWRAIAPLNFELGIKVGGVLEFSGSQL